MTKDTRPKLSFVEQMMLLRDAIAPIAKELGMATSRSLVISRRVVGESSLKIDFLEISPQPIIERVSPKQATNFNGTEQIKNDDLQIFGISRKYPREWIVGTGISYFVDAVLINNQIRGGFECDFISIEEQPLTWNLILRRRTDERRGI